MKPTKAEIFFDHWKEILFISFFVLVAVPAFIYHIATIDPKLKNADSRHQLEDKLAKEMKGISLPSKTAVNKFQSNSKDFSIYVSTRYRTEIEQQKFVNHLTQELKKNGWTSYRGGSSNDYNFCRDNQDASLSYEGKGGFSRDDGNYFNLSFTVGLMSGSESSRPPSCK